ncbi:MAG: transcription termination factor NusA [Armatimonadetes bacterium]|nr:transcription termination factor NusA [Armatimonadota bacterium]MDW8121964.1 transcription termination factor NusA [Armatimonadota bacterium]
MGSPTFSFVADSLERTRMSAELVGLIQQIARDKELRLEEVLGAVCDGLKVAFERQFLKGIDKASRPRPKITAELDLEAKVLKLSLEKTVVVGQPSHALEISLEEAQTIKPDAKVGEKIWVDLPLAEFSRSAMNTARHETMSRIREIELQRVYDAYKDRVHTLVTGVVLRKDSYQNVYFALDKGEGIAFRRDLLPTDNFQKGERVRLYISEVREPKRNGDPIVILSRTHKDFVAKLLELEVPEIREGIVQIKALVRDPGYRSKVAVASKDSKVDPAGACIGPQGKRVDNIVKELRGERIDILPWRDDPIDLLIEALNPARVETVIINRKNGSATVIVSEDQLSLAIGKQGKNVSLAARLTGLRLDIRTVNQLIAEQQVTNETK